MNKFTSICLAVSACCMAGVISSAHDMPTPKAMPAEFEKVKKLEGHWEGTTKMGDKEEPVVADYKLTSGGSAMVEHLFPGTPHEMVSVYHAEGKGVAMSHYCMLGNHPEMTLKKVDDNSMFFEMAGKAGIDSSKEAHMHSLLITFKSPTEMTEEWTNFENGKKKDKVVFNLAKK